MSDPTPTRPPPRPYAEAYELARQVVAGRGTADLRWDYFGRLFQNRGLAATDPPLSPGILPRKAGALSAAADERFVLGIEHGIALALCWAYGFEP